MPDNAMPLAHTRPGGRHLLDAHLIATAERARRFAEPFGAGDWAYLAGLWHDLGKYQPAFQAYLRRAADPDAHCEGRAGRVDHSTPGRSSRWRPCRSMAGCSPFLSPATTPGCPIGCPTSRPVRRR